MRKSTCQSGRCDYRKIWKDDKYLEELIDISNEFKDSKELLSKNVNEQRALLNKIIDIKEK